MIARPTHWRVTSDGREVVAAAGEATSLENLATNGAKTGVTTSRRYTRGDYEFLAWRYGMSVDAVKRAIALGLLERHDARHP